MANEVVKYNNYLNNLALTGFKEVELDLLMTICARMKNQDIDRITLSFEELKILSDSTRRRLDDFVNDLSKTNEKLARITCKIETQDELVYFVLFPTFVINKKMRNLTVAVNPDFRFVLNDLNSNFTRFELNEFVHLSGRYSKQLYRLLKQYRTLGKVIIPLDDFRRKMDIPMSYRVKDILEKVIKPTLKELSPYFKGLNVNVEHAKRRGSPVTGYSFTFQKETISKKSEQKKTKSNKSIKPKKNSFNNFEQRTYSDEEMKEIEKALLDLN